MARHAGPHAWICNMCHRLLPETEFATDGWRKARRKGPGRCRKCDREYARVKTDVSPTGRYTDADHALAYHITKDICANHDWADRPPRRGTTAELRDKGFRADDYPTPTEAGRAAVRLYPEATPAQRLKIYRAGYSQHPTSRLIKNGDNRRRNQR